MAIDLRWRSVSFYNDISLFPIVGSINILYVDRAAMLIYIWNGSSYEATEGGSGGSSITVVANYAALPDPTTVTASFYWCSASQGTAWLPGSLGGSYYNSGLYYSNGTTWEYMSSPYQATQVEVDAGVISDKFVTPSTFYNSSKWATFSSGLSSINGLTEQTQYLAVGTSGTDFNIDSTTDTHTFNLPTASATNRGALKKADWSMFNAKMDVPTTFKWTLDLNAVLTGDIYPNQPCTIASVANIVGSPTTSILKNGLAYTFGGAIVSGDKITVMVSVASVIDLNFTI